MKFPISLPPFYIVVSILLNSLSCLFIVCLLGACTPSTSPEEGATPDPTNQDALKKLTDGRYNAAFLIMDGVYNTELTAPYDIFQHTIFRDSIKAMNVFMVANTLDPITSFEGIRLLPDFNYLQAGMPPIDILVVPSAEHHLDSDLEDEKMIEFVKQTARKAQFVSSHCDGAFVLAKAGLLDSVASTTFPSDITAYKKMFPKLDVREDVIFVHDGKYITSAGGARSFDAALYLCEFLYGKKVAQQLAQGLVIDWEVEKIPRVVIEKK